jgi:hypothetical protein
MSKIVRILGIAGSLRRESYNRAAPPDGAGNFTDEAAWWSVTVESTV